VSFKIFTKVGTNRVTSIASRVVRPTQTAFIPGRNILEGVVVLHETIHEMHRKKLDGVLFKIDFEKAYDKVNWDFLQQVLRMKGFEPMWCEWVARFVQGGSVGIRVNDDIGHYFQTLKGLRQGDPLSPLLFNLVADMLAILIMRAKEDGQVGGLIPHLVDGGVSILQYADDTILFLEHDIAKAVNMKLILAFFEQLSGLKINYHKSELYCFGKAVEVRDQYRNIFGCEIGSLPFKYLGIPIHYRKLLNKEWKTVEDRFDGKLGAWVAKMLSYGDRLVLINSVLTSLPMFMLSFFDIPKGVRKRLDYYRSRFFWQSNQQKRKYRLTKWNIVCRPKDQGGLGIEVLEIKNKCLLSKWIFKLLTEEGVWKELLTNKYLGEKTLSQVQLKPTDSPFWKGIMKVKDDFLKFGSFKIGDGNQTRFWEDIWLGNNSIADEYPSLYAIASHKNITVASVFGSNPINLRFRRSLIGNNREVWFHLIERLMRVQILDEPDRFIWALTPTGVYSTKSYYAELLNGHTQYLRKYLWKLKVPLKIRIFLWFLHRKELLTKDNLIKRKWIGCKKCVFCDADESVQHLFISCPFARDIWRIIHFTFNIKPPSSVGNLFGSWLNGVDKRSKELIRVGTAAVLWAIWNCRNDIIFNKTTPFHYLQVINKTTYWIHMWSFLLPVERRGLMDSACTRMTMVVRAIFCQGGWRQHKRIDG
jgi:hypothetical protein